MRGPNTSSQTARARPISLSTAALGHDLSKGSAEALLALFNVPAAIVDSRFIVILANEAAWRIGSQEPALRIVRDRIAFGPAFRDGASLLGDVLAGREKHATIIGDNHPLALQVISLPLLTAAGETAALVILRPLDGGILIGRVAARAFGLSQAEARLATMLTEGSSLPAAATRLGIAHETARVQIKSIFSKTGTTSQGALVRLLLVSSCPMIAAE